MNFVFDTFQHGAGPNDTIFLTDLSGSESKNYGLPSFDTDKVDMY